MITEDIKKIASKIENYYCGRGDKYIEKALIALSKSENHNALLRAKTEHTRDIDEHKLFDGIDKVIAYLTSLKEEGYTRIEECWSGYEDNYFVAIKIEDETDHEYCLRLIKAITPYIKQFLEKEDEEIAKLRQRIQELEEELRQLKNK